MNPHSFSTDDNRKFWSQNQSSYHGSHNAPWLIFLSKEFIGQHILDAGAGDGSLVSALREHFPSASVAGIDLAPKRDDIETGDLTALPYDDSTFDTVYCSEVIEHVPMEDADKIAAELFRVLKPAGHVVFTTPYAEDLAESLVTCPQCDCSFHRYGHQLSLDESDLESLMDRAGFTDKAIFPVKMSKVRRYRFMGPRFFRSNFMTKRARKARGKRTLIAAARKPE